VSTAIVTIGPITAPTPSAYTLTHIRGMGGIDVAASASTDPAAKFLLDGTFELPITTGTGTVYSPFWIAGDVRLASIAQPGAISGLSNAATYVQSLTDSTPSQLVQSAEIAFATEASIFKFADKTPKQQVTTLHVIAEGGALTPLSPSQASPTIYTVTQSLYSYYTSTNPPSAAASSAITAACGATFSTTTPCYVAYLPEGRTRFYRDWDAGFRFRFYDEGSDASGKGTGAYMFPSSATISVGQNEYVTGGEMRGLVLHAGGTLLVPAPQSSSLAGFLYVYGAVDLNLNGKNQNSQQFLLQTAPSTVTASSSSVAVVPVASQTRDRYRFGIAIDLGKLVSLLSKTSSTPSSSSTAK